MFWEIGPVKAVNVCCDLHAQYHILVLLGDGHHHIYYLNELESCALCQESGDGGCNEGGESSW